MKTHVLIIKHGALGDVVRTSYFAGALRRKYGSDLRLSWITSVPSQPLLQYNPHIDDLWTSFEPAKPHAFDVIFSFDDELDVVTQVMALNAKKISGAYLAGSERVYSDDVREWFDMGLLSRLGKAQADELKKRNQRSHGDIFKHMFGVNEVRAEFFLPEEYKTKARNYFNKRPGEKLIGVNPYAGGRWPAKELPTEEFRTLLRELCAENSVFVPNRRIALFGSGDDRDRNLAMFESVGCSESRVVVPNTDQSILEFAALIAELDYLVTSDSLAMHLAIAQGVRCLTFFAPTSAVEIDSFGVCVKISSTADDYCSYRKDADNRSITAARILETMRTNGADLFVSAQGRA